MKRFRKSNLATRQLSPPFLGDPQKRPPPFLCQGKPKAAATRSGSRTRWARFIVPLRERPATVPSAMLRASGEAYMCDNLVLIWVMETRQT